MTRARSDGRSIHPRELEGAQGRLIESRQPGAKAAATPRPERIPGGNRAEASAAVDRPNAREVPERARPEIVHALVQQQIQSRGMHTAGGKRN
jgi:hypothetical protein